MNNLKVIHSFFHFLLQEAAIDKYGHIKNSLPVCRKGCFLLERYIRADQTILAK